MAKEIKFELDALSCIQEGADLLGNSVGITLGPKGRNVLVKRNYGSSGFTKDGVTVAKEVESNKPSIQACIEVVREAAKKTDEVAGDGTTTATVVAQSVVGAGHKYIVAGCNPVLVKRGMDKSTEQVLNYLKSKAVLIGNDSARLREVATISANNDSTLGNLIIDAFEEVKFNGLVNVSESKTFNNSIETINGMEFDRGYVSKYLVTNAEKMIAEYESPEILVIDGACPTSKSLLPVLEYITDKRTALVIIADDFDLQLVNWLITNKLKIGMKVLLIKSPGLGDKRKEMAIDISIAVGGRLVSEALGNPIEEFDPSYLGSCDSILCTENSTRFIGAKGNQFEIDERVARLRVEVEECESEFNKDKLTARIAKLTNGVANILIGSSSELEYREIKDRMVDAIRSTESAIEEGILVGGGTALLRASRIIDTTSFDEDEKIGALIIKRALEEPIRRISENGGYPADVTVATVLANDDFNFGFNAKTGKFEDLMAAGVIDPLKVTRCAFDNGQSVGGMLLTVGCSMVFTNDTPDPIPMPG